MIRSLECCTSEAKRASLRCRWIFSLRRAPSSASASWVPSAFSASRSCRVGAGGQREQQELRRAAAHRQREHGTVA